jgi:hypothetical protein
MSNGTEYHDVVLNIIYLIELSSLIFEFISVSISIGL